MFTQDSRNFVEKLDTFALQMAMNPVKFGPNLKNVRELRNLTQEQLADQSHVSLRAVQRWESGKTAPRGANLRTLLDVLQVDLGDLLQDDADAGNVSLTLSQRLERMEANQLRIESKLDAVLAIFTDADELAAAIDRRRSEAPGEYEGLLPRGPGARGASAPKRAARRAKTS